MLKNHHPVGAMSSVRATASADMFFGKFFIESGTEYVLSGDDGHDPVACAVAVSCLVKPAPGDYVMVARTDRGCFVLSVLASELPARRDIVIQGDVAMTGGKMSMHYEDIQLISRRVSTVSQELQVMCESVEVDAERVQSHLTRFVCTVKDYLLNATTVVANMRNRIATVGQTDFLKANTRISEIAKADLTKAGSLSVNVTDGVSVRGTTIKFGGASSKKSGLL